jgi:hypothetical protein
MTPDDVAREIARCEQEIAAMERQSTTAPAFLTTLGIEDWRAEKRILERQHDEAHKSQHAHGA